MWLGGLILKRANFPSSHHREEGWRRHQENGAKPPYGRRRGGVPCPIDRNTTPSSRKPDAAQYFLDRSATLLAVMRGGEFDILKIVPRLGSSVAGVVAHKSRCGVSDQPLLTTRTSRFYSHLPKMRQSTFSHEGYFSTSRVAADLYRKSDLHDWKRYEYRCGDLVHPAKDT